MPTVAQILTNAARKLKLNVPSTFVGGNQTAKSLLVCLDLAGKDLATRYDWGVLHRSHTITLATGTTSYALPDDYSRPLDQTAWNTSNRRRVLNGITPQDFTALENSVGNVPDFDALRTKGWLDTQINLYTTPTTSNAGQQIAFDYVSNAWLRPRKWATGISVSTGAAVWYNGNRYTVDAGGTTGSTPPTHTSGSVSDGSINLTYVADYGYESIVADTDVPHLDDLLLTYMVITQFADDEGFDASKYEAKAAQRLQQIKADFTGASEIYSFGRWRTSAANFPETGFTGY